VACYANSAVNIRNDNAAELIAYTWCVAIGPCALADRYAFLLSTVRSAACDCQTRLNRKASTLARDTHGVSLAHRWRPILPVGLKRSCRITSAVSEARVFSRTRGGFPTPNGDEGSRGGGGAALTRTKAGIMNGTPRGCTSWHAEFPDLSSGTRGRAKGDEGESSLRQIADRCNEMRPRYVALPFPLHVRDLSDSSSARSIPHRARTYFNPAKRGLHCRLARMAPCTAQTLLSYRPIIRYCHGTSRGFATCFARRVLSKLGALCAHRGVLNAQSVSFIIHLLAISIGISDVQSPLLRIL